MLSDRYCYFLASDYGLRLLGVSWGVGVGVGGVGLSETLLGVLQFWRGFGSRCPKLRFWQNLGFQACPGRVLQLRCCATGCNRFVEHLDEEETRPKSSSAHVLSGVFGWVRFNSPGIARTCWEKPRLELLQPQGETGSACSKLHFRQNPRRPSSVGRVLQLRCCTTRPAAPVLSLSSG